MSAGSGKSYFIACKIIIKALNDKRRVLVCRKYGSTLKQSVMQLFKEVLTKWKIIDYCKISDHNRMYELPNGSQILFMPLDEESKLLSLQNISDVWLEEVTEVEKEIFDQLNLRMRGKAKSQQIFLSFNPISQHHWLYNFCVENPPESFKLLHSTYKDNRFLNQDYISALEELYRTNPRKAIVYCDGLWSNDPDGLVFKNIRVSTFDINELMGRKNIDIRIGCDTGTIDPTAIVVSLFDHDTKECFIIQELYKRNLTLDSLYEEIKSMGILKYNRSIYIDSADIRAYNYLKSKYIMIKKCIKGRGSIEAGISFLQNYDITIHPSCINTIKEMETYSYHKDIKLGIYVEGKYDKVYGDHAIDALRYSVCDLYTGNVVKVSSKSKYGL